MRGAERSQPGLTPAERELEDALRGLSPAASRIDRDRVLFEAGAAVEHARTRRLAWVTGALAAGLALTMMWRPAPRVVDRLVYVPVTQETGAEVAQVAVPDQVKPTSPVMVASLSSMPFPVPGGTFVPLPSGLVGRMGVEPGAITRSGYLTKIQGVVQNGWTALPSTSDPGVIGPDDTLPGAPPASKAGGEAHKG